jgi:hypothetical protein
MLGVITKTLRGGLGLIISFWIAGAGCMFGCQNMVGSAATRDDTLGHEQGLATIVSGDACASNSSHDCCAKKKVEASRAKASLASARPSLQTAVLLSQTESLSGGPSGSIKECPMAMSRAVAVTKTSGSKQVAATVVPALKALLVAHSNERQISLSPNARLPNRGHTYLSCCALLI